MRTFQGAEGLVGFCGSLSFRGMLLEFKGTVLVWCVSIYIEVVTYLDLYRYDIMKY